MTSELREITTKHRAEDAAVLRRAVAELDDGKRSLDALRLLYLGLHMAERIEQAFRPAKVVALRPNQPDPPRVA